MIGESNIDFGSVHIHEKAIADIASSAVSEIEGVSVIPDDWKDKALEYFGRKKYSGITVTIDKDHQVSIEVKILVRYGVNIPEVGRQVQEAVRIAVEKIADISLKDINVNIQGVERGKT